MKDGEQFTLGHVRHVIHASENTFEYDPKNPLDTFSRVYLALSQTKKVATNPQNDVDKGVLGGMLVGCVFFFWC